MFIGQVRSHVGSFFFNVIEIQEERYKRSAAVTQLMKRLIEQGESIKQQLRTLR